VHRLRLLLAILIFSAFCLVFGILWMEIICLQALTLVTLLLLCLMQLGWRKTWKQLKLIAPFALSLLLMYGILVLLGIAPRDQAPWLTGPVTDCPGSCCWSLLCWPSGSACRCSAMKGCCAARQISTGRNI